MPLPDFTSFHPGYEEIKRKRNAVRRCSVTSAALRAAARAPLGRARLPAFHRGSCRRDSCIPTAQLRARLRGASTDRWRGYPARRRPRLQRAPRVPVIVSAGLIPEPPGNDADEASPAGTALAPPTAVTRPTTFTERD